jgi:hypothetical protein
LEVALHLTQVLTVATAHRVAVQEKTEQADQVPLVHKATTAAMETQPQAQQAVAAVEPWLLDQTHQITVMVVTVARVFLAVLLDQVSVMRVAAVVVAK